MKSAQSQFPLVTQPKRMINQTGGSVEERIAEERESSNAQIGTMLKEQRKKLMVLQPQGPTAQDHLTTTGTQDSGLILSQTQMTKMLEVVACVLILESSLQRLIYPHEVCLSGFIVKQALYPLGLIFETRSNCQDFVARFKDDGLPYAVDSPFDRTVRQSMSPEDKEIGRRFNPLWEVVLVPKYGNFSRW